MLATVRPVSMGAVRAQLRFVPRCGYDSYLVTTPIASSASDVEGPHARYVQVADQIVSDINSGRLAPGRRLASERELCERLSVSRDTLRRALAVVAEAGYISPSARRGWFVSAGGYSEPLTGSLGFTEWAAAEGLPTTTRVLATRVRLPTAQEAAALRIAATERVFELERVRLVDDLPLSLDRSSPLASQVSRALESQTDAPGAFGVPL